MAINKKEVVSVVDAAPVEVDVQATIVSFASRITELEGDLVRISELLSAGNMDCAKFREIVTKRQGKA